MNREQEVARATDGVALPPGVAIRAWTDADFAAIQALSTAQGWTTPTARPEASRASWQHAWPALVAVAGDEVAGFVRAITDGFVSMYIAELLVAPAWRGKGIGAALLEVCHRLYPETRLDLLCTDGADAFYVREGFRPFPGYRKRYG